MKRVIVTAVLCCLLSLTITAQELRQFTVEDLWSLKQVSSPVLSPDGAWIAATVTEYDMEENSGSSDIWLFSTDGSKTLQLTTNEASDSSPTWSPDSKTIAFVSSRGDDGSQVWLISIDGGEAQQLTTIPTGAGGLRWPGDGSYIYFISSVWPDCETDDCLQERIDEIKERKVTAHVTESTLFRYWNRYLTDGRVPVLYRVNVETGVHENLFNEAGIHFSVLGADYSNYDVHPDGNLLALEIETSLNEGLGSNADIFLMDLDTGDLKNITVNNSDGDYSPQFSDDGSKLAYQFEREPMVPEYYRIAVYFLEADRNKVLTEGFEYSPSYLDWNRSGDRLYFSAGVAGRSPVYSVDLTGELLLQFQGNSMGDVVVSPDETRVYFSREALDLPPTLFAADLYGENEVQLSHFNDDLLSEIAFHSSEVHTFKGADVEDVELFLLKPHDFDENKKYPLVQLIHGGPHGAFGDGFHPRWNAQLFAAPGYVVAMVNFHGSTTFGQDFLDSIAGAEADKPYEDVMKATDYLLSLGYIDENRMAAGGGSYGGYLANWIATQTDRFVTLFTHAGGFNHHGMFASDSPRYRERRWGGYPWENQAATDRQSPNRFAANIKTPMLIIHGELDYRVVVTQGIELYNTLQIMGIPSKLIIFPDEGHWIGKPQNARLWWNEIHDWLARYLSENE